MKNSIHPFLIESIEENSGFLLWQLINVWQQQQKKLLKKKFNISHSQYVSLASAYWLTLHGEEVTQITLCQHTKIEPMTLSQILKGLEEIGYIVRHSHSKDTRAKAVSLSDKGKILMKDAVSAIEDHDITFFSSLGKGVSRFNTEMIKLIKANINASDYLTFVLDSE